MPAGLDPRLVAHQRHMGLQREADASGQLTNLQQPRTMRDLQDLRSTLLDTYGEENAEYIDRGLESRGFEPSVIEEFGKGFRRGSYGAVEAAGTAVEAIGNRMGWEGVEAIGAEFRDIGDIGAQDPELQPWIDDFRQIDGAGNALRFVSGLAGGSTPEMTAAIAGTLATGGAGAAAGAGTAVINGLRVLGGFAPSSTFHFGRNVAAQMEEQGITMEEVDIGKAATASAVQGMAESVIPFLLAKRLGGSPAQYKGAANKMVARVKRTGQTAGLDAIIEGGTEAFQEAVGIIQASPEMKEGLAKLQDPQVLEQLAQAAVGGAALGGPLGAAGKGAQEMGLAAERRVKTEETRQRRAEQDAEREATQVDADRAYLVENTDYDQQSIDALGDDAVRKIAGAERLRRGDKQQRPVTQRQEQIQVGNAFVVDTDDGPVRVRATGPENEFEMYNPENGERIGEPFEMTQEEQAAIRKIPVEQEIAESLKVDEESAAELMTLREHRDATKTEVEGAEAAEDRKTLTGQRRLLKARQDRDEAETAYRERIGELKEDYGDALTNQLVQTVEDAAPERVEARRKAAEQAEEKARKKAAKALGKDVKRLKSERKGTPEDQAFEDAFGTQEGGIEQARTELGQDMDLRDALEQAAQPTPTQTFVTPTAEEVSQATQAQELERRMDKPPEKGTEKVTPEKVKAGEPVSEPRIAARAKTDVATAAREGIDEAKAKKKKKGLKTPEGITTTPAPKPEPEQKAEKRPRGTVEVRDFRVPSLQGLTVDEVATQTEAEPSEAQAQAGNYKKGQFRVGGLEGAIETPAGGKRSGVDEHGRAWEHKMKDHYGYIKRTEGADGDQVDVFLKRGTNELKAQANPVFVIERNKKGQGKRGTFDEHKVMIGYRNADEARAAFERNYDSPERAAFRDITELEWPQFKRWVRSMDPQKAGVKIREPADFYSQPGQTHMFMSPDSRDLTQEFKESGYPADASGAKAWVLEKGKETGHEYMVVMDGENVVLAATSNSDGMIDFSVELMNMYNRPEFNLVMHHNHPGSRGLSSSDIATAWRRGGAETIAYGHNNETVSRVTFTPEQKAKTNPEHIQRMLANADTAMMDALIPMVRRRVLEPEQAKALHYKLIHDVLREEGIMEIETVIPAVKLPDYVQEEILDAKSKVARGIRIDSRSAEPIRPARGAPQVSRVREAASEAERPSSEDWIGGEQSLGRAAATLSAVESIEHGVYDESELATNDKAIKNRVALKGSKTAVSWFGLNKDLTVPNPNRKAPRKDMIRQSTNEANASDQSAVLDVLHKHHPTPMESDRAFAKYLGDATRQRRVPAPPYMGIKMKNDPSLISDQLNRMTEGMKRDARAGMRTAQRLGELYAAGKVTPQTTAKLFMWGILSRGVSPYVQEGAFIDAVLSPELDAILEKAIAGQGVDMDAYLKWAKKAMPEGEGLPGAGTSHNLNAFGRNFLSQMTVKVPDGRTKIQYVHDMISDGTPSRVVRRKFLELSEGAGIDNKVMSFILLLAGRKDVIVLDRVQVRNLWDDGRYNDVNLYDGQKRKVPSGAFYKNGKPKMKSEDIPHTKLADVTAGHIGLVFYEALEDGLAGPIKQAYASVGRPEEGSLGQWHWESWVESSDQEVGHHTIEGIVAEAEQKQDPYAGVFVRQGKYNAYDYGAKYTLMDDGNRRIVFDLSDGTTYALVPNKMGTDNPLGKALNKLKPKAQKRVGTSRPWTAGLTKEEREKYDAAIKSAGEPVTAGTVRDDSTDASGRSTGVEEPNDPGYAREQFYERLGGIQGLGDGLLRPFRGRVPTRETLDVVGTDVPLLREFALDPELAQILAEGGAIPQKMYQLDNTQADSPKVAKAFHSAILRAKDSLLDGAQVHAYDPHEYEGMRLFVNENSTAGFALKGNDIVSVFKHSTGPTGFVDTMLPLAIQEGGKKLDCFDTYLPKLYSRHGMRATSRLPWVDEFAPDDWNTELGKPDVLFMALDGERTPYKKGDGPYAEDYDQAVAMQDAAVAGYEAERMGRAAEDPGEYLVEEGKVNYAEYISDGKREQESMPAAAVRSMYQWARGDGKASGLKSARLRVEQAIANQFAPIRELELRRKGKLEEGMDSAFKSAEIAMNSSGRADMLMNYGAAKRGDNGEVTVAEGTEGGLMAIYKKAGGTGKNKGQKLADWQEWMVARRAADIKRTKPGVASIIPDDAIKAGLDKEQEGFQEAAEMWKRFNDANVDFARDSGLISAKEAVALKADGAYVPFYRAPSVSDLKDGNVSLASGREINASRLSHANPKIKKLKGGWALPTLDPKTGQMVEGSQIDNILLNMVHNSKALVEESMKNDAASKTLDLLQDIGEVEILGRKAKKDGAIKVTRNGKEIYFRPDDPALTLALAGMRPAQRDGIWRFMRSVAAFFRGGVTLAPSFMIRNLIRGAVSTGVLTGGNMSLQHNTLTGLADYWKKPEVKSAFTRMSGMGDYSFGAGSAGLPRNLMIDLGLDKHGFMSRVRQAIDGMEKLGTATELADRLALYQNLIKKGVRPDEAAYQALNVMNYGRRGANQSLQTLLPLVPFLNARIQGLYRLGEDARTRGNGESALKAMKGVLARGAVLAAFSAGLWAMNNWDEEDRERYQAEPLHRRLNYHIVYLPNGKKVLIPKAFEIGAAFGSLPELVGQAAIGRGDEAAPAVMQTLLNTFAFNPLPQAVLPMVELWSNYNFFTDRPLENMAQQRLTTADRQNPDTAFLASKMSKAFQGIPGVENLSPIEIEHLLTGYGGFFGTLLLGAADAGAGSAGLMPERPSGAFGDVPVASNVLQNILGLGSMFKDIDADAANRYVGDFYEAKRLNTEIFNSFKEARLKGDLDYARELLTKAPAAPIAYKLLNRAGREMSKINRALRTLRADLKMDAGEKRRKMKPLINARNKLARQVVEQIRDMEDALEDRAA